MAFIIAGVLSVVAHNIVVGPIVVGSERAVHMGHAQVLEQGSAHVSAKKVKKPQSLNFVPHAK